MREKIREKGKAEAPKTLKMPVFSRVLDLKLDKIQFGSDIVYMAMLNAKHVGTRQSSRLLYRPVYKEVFSPPGVTDEPQNVFHDALLNYQKHYLLF